MSGTSRTVVIVLAALALAVGGYLLVRPDDDEPSGSATTPTATTATATTSTTTTTKTVEATTVPVPEATRVTLKDGAPVGGLAKIEVTKGETIRLTVASDAAAEIHVHGFDIEKEAAPGQPARFRFKADIEGRFEVEAHPSATQIAEITVNP